MLSCYIEKPTQTLNPPVATTSRVIENSVGHAGVMKRLEWLAGRLGCSLLGRYGSKKGCIFYPCI